MYLSEPIKDDFNHQPQPLAEQPSQRGTDNSPPITRIAPAKNQVGAAEKNIARFLEQAGLAETVMADSEFYLQIENNPYIPLVVERHDESLHFIHWLKDSYDELFIDSEMIFHLSDRGRLTLRETAVQNALTGGELRARDKGFARLFSRNILQQGFAEAVHQMRTEQQLVESPQSEMPQSELDPSQSAEVVLNSEDPVPTIDSIDTERTLLRFGTGNLVRLEPEELTAIRETFSASRQQPETHLRARLAEILEPAVGRRNTTAAVEAVLVDHQRYESVSANEAQSSKELSLDWKTVDRSPLAPFSTEYLDTKDQYPEGYTVVLHEVSQQVPPEPKPAELLSEPSKVQDSSEEPPEVTATLFDLDGYLAGQGDYSTDIQGFDPTWEINRSSSSMHPPDTPSTVEKLSSNQQPQIKGDQDHSQNPTPRSVEITTLADEVRNFDLMTVAANLGLEQDRGDKHKWIVRQLNVGLVE